MPGRPRNGPLLGLIKNFNQQTYMGTTNSSNIDRTRTASKFAVKMWNPAEICSSILFFNFVSRYAVSGNECMFTELKDPSTPWVDDPLPCFVFVGISIALSE
jgi:hypothetical protein